MRVNLASGSHPAPSHWVNLDVLPQTGLHLRADVMHLPFRDSSVEAAYAGHLLEHVPLSLMGDFLNELRRVLSPQSGLMIVGPDVDRCVRTRQPMWLLDDVIAHGEGPGGHEWTCSTAVLLWLLHLHGWHGTELDIATVTAPTWPNPSTAPWQLCVWATPQ